MKHTYDALFTRERAVSNGQNNPFLEGPNLPTEASCVTLTTSS